MSRMAKDALGRRVRRQFSEEFKDGAVRLVLDEGKTIGAVARELDLTASALAHWVKQARAERTQGKSGLVKEEREELFRLRREVRELRMEREVLKNVWSAPPLQGLGSSNGESRLRQCIRPTGGASGSWP
jgi:transposase